MREILVADSDPAITVFARMARDGHLNETDRRIMRAFEDLKDGRPAITDGSMTTVNIAAEAGVSRASYYRSPVATAIREILAAGDYKPPEVDLLNAEITRLRKAEHDLRHEKAVEIRQLKDTIATYANQIQVLALRNASLEAQVRALQSQVASAPGAVVRQLH